MGGQAQQLLLVHYCTSSKLTSAGGVELRRKGGKSWRHSTAYHPEHRDACTCRLLLWFVPTSKIFMFPSVVRSDPWSIYLHCCSLVHLLENNPSGLHGSQVHPLCNRAILEVQAFGHPPTRVMIRSCALSHCLRSTA